MDFERVCIACGYPAWTSDPVGKQKCPRCDTELPEAWKIPKLEEEKQKVVAFTIDGGVLVFDSREEYEEYRKHMVNKLFNNAFVTTLAKPRRGKIIPKKEEANANEGSRTVPRPNPTDAAD